uniref:C2H2-type domain-containing protein n=2 Tax=Meloidogyne incognita group TaxID=654580 RepID=A0A914MU75_MELIC
MMVEEEKMGRETKRQLIMTEEGANLRDLNGFMEEDFNEVDREGGIVSPTITGSPAKSDDCDVMSDHDSNGTTTEFENGEKPFFCSWKNCQKRFANKFLLKKHHFIHTGLKPHICQFCKKPFNRKDNLLRHKKTHLQNGMSSSEGIKRRHNMLRGITEQMAIELQLLPLNSREGRQRGINNDNRRAKMGGGGTQRMASSSSCSDECGGNIN